MDTQLATTLPRDKRSGRGSGRGLNKVVQTVLGGARKKVHGAAEAADGLRRRTNIPYTSIGESLNRIAANPGPAVTRQQWSKGVIGLAKKQIDPIKVGLVGGAVGAAAGGAITAVTSGDYGGVTLPGSDYIGPGNDIAVDAPKSESEAIAKFHDISYQELLTAAQRGLISQKEFLYAINHTDRASADQFDKEFRQSGDWHAFIGAYGLKFKNWAESHIGVVYPSYPKRKYLLSDGLEKYSAIRSSQLGAYERRPTALCNGAI